MFQRIWQVAGFAIVAFTLSGCDRYSPQEHLDRALTFRSKGDFNSAIIEYKNALQKEPNFAEARMSLGEYYLELDDIASAVKELERALDLKVAPERVLPPLLEAKADAGRTQEVLGTLDGLTMTPRLQAVRGQALLATGDVERARADFEGAKSADASTARAYLGLAVIARSGPNPDFKKAADIVEQGTRAAPSSRRLWLALGELDLTLNQPAAAIQAYEKARAIPGDPSLANLGLSRAYLLQNDPDKALQLVNDVIGRAPKHPLARHLRGVIELQRKDLDAAETDFELALNELPEFPPTLLAMAHVKYEKKQPRQTEAFLTRYVAAVPDSVAARQSLASLRLASGNAAGAVDALAPVTAQLTSGPELALLGAAYLRAGQLDEAARYLTSAGNSAPAVPALRTELALSLAAAGDDEAALAQLEPVVPNDSAALQSEAVRVALSVRNGKLDEALAAAKQLVEKNPESALAYNLLGTVQIARQDRAAARAAFDQALRADPGFGVSAMNLARLDQVEGKETEARQRLEKFLESDPKDVDVLLTLAEMAMHSGDRDNAGVLLQRASDAEPQSIRARIALAQFALTQGDLPLAERVSGEAEAIDGKHPDVLLLRAQVCGAKGQGAVLAGYLDKLESYLSSAPVAAAAPYRVPVGDLQRQVGRIDAARTNLEAALQSRNADPPALLALVQLETAAHRLDAARGYLKRLTAQGLQPPLLAELEGDIAYQSGQIKPATELYEKAVTAGSRSATQKLATVQMNAGDASAAQTTLESWLSKNPNDDAVAMMLASTRLNAGDKSGARRDYESLLPRHGDDPVLLNNLAWLYFEAGDPRAEGVARKALTVAGDNPDIADTVGWILLSGDAPGAASEALPLLEKAARARESNPTVLYHLAVAQQKAGRSREAKRSVDRALQLGAFPERPAAEELATVLAR